MIIMKGKKKIRVWIPLIHFVCSFLYERSILIFSLDKDVVAAIPRNQIISDLGERVVGYVFAKAFAFLFIFCLWRLIFYIADHIRETEIKVLLAVALLGMIGISFLWPEVFIASWDNQITYSYALRFWPEYWHSVYTSFVYTAAMMVAPFPIAITLLQWIFACFVFGYLFRRIKYSRVLPAGRRYWLLTILLMPRLFTLMTDSYRTEIYALVCTLLISKTVMDLLEQKRADTKTFIGILCLCGLISVWRTEGIILGIPLCVVWIVFIQRYTFKKAILGMGLLFCVFIAFLLPQKLGDLKYYGKDYSFINSFPTMMNILNCETANLSYDGVEEDLAAIERVVPVEVVKQMGMEGYRRYNYHNGRGDINQSLASKEDGKAYMKAYYGLVLHNPVIYAKTQASMLLSIWMIKPSTYVESYKGSEPVTLPGWYLAAWDVGLQDLRETGETEAWMTWETRERISHYPNACIRKIESILQKSYIYTFVMLLIPAVQIFMVFREGYLWIRRRSSGLGMAVLSFVLLGQAFAITLVMPANALVYFHAYYFCSYVVVLVYLISRGQNRNGEKALQEREL